ncbi:MAG: HNH endonuclease [Acidimicrobiales bacterium]|jgi:putative restriction endonuclease|nr:HNH endonuclease [Acidimicrobiales bacterium]
MPSVAKGRYRPFWPAVIAEDHPETLHVAVELFEGASAGVDLAVVPVDATAPAKSYAKRLTLQRLHQAGFRERVLRAYRQCCAVCRLRHVELLDAAHILPDTDPRSIPVVPNGLALCKIHHAAYDRHILGVRRDLVIEIRPDVLAEHDGPMLRHGLQAVHGQALLLPKRIDERPDPGFLEERYDAFRRAS